MGIVDKLDREIARLDRADKKDRMFTNSAITYIKRDSRIFAMGYYQNGSFIYNWSDSYGPPIEKTKYVDAATTVLRYSCQGKPYGEITLKNFIERGLPY